MLCEKAIGIFGHNPKAIAGQFLPGVKPCILFDWQSHEFPGFVELDLPPVTCDDTLAYVRALLPNPDDHKWHLLMGGRPWATVAPSHQNIVVTIRMADVGFDIWFHRRQPVNPPVPNPDAPSESN